MNLVHDLMAIDLTWAATAEFLLGAPLRILLTVVLAWVARYLVHRAISGAVDQALARREATRARRDHHGRDRGAAAGEDIPALEPTQDRQVLPGYSRYTNDRRRDSPTATFTPAGGSGQLEKERTRDPSRTWL